MEQPAISPYAPGSPRVLVVTRNFPPLVGGMERLTRHTVLAFAAQYSTAVCGPRGGQNFLPDGVGYRELPATPLWQFLAMAPVVAFGAALRDKPDLVVAASGLTAPAAVLAGRLCGKRVACYLHGLDLVADHPLYRTLFLPALRACDAWLANSRNTRTLAIEIGISAERVTVLPPGVTLPETEHAGEVARIFRQQFDCCHRPLLLSVGRLTERKGLAEFIVRALPRIVAAHPETLLIVVGAPAKQAAKTPNKDVLADMHEAAERAGMQAHVRWLGTLDDATLTAAYFASQLLVFPVLELPGDVEGFGMVALEAAAHGLPTLAFAAGGVPDAVAEGRSGWLIAPGDYMGFAETANAYLAACPNQELRASCRTFAAAHSWERFGERLRAWADDELRAA